MIATGEIIMLNLTSPREVVRKAWEGWQSGVFVKEFGRLTTRRGELGDHSDHSWCQQLIRDLALTKGFDGRARAIALQLMAGTVPTGAWLNAHGWRTEGMCGCGEIDTVAHRLGGCPIRGECPVKGIRTYKDFWALLDTPPLPRKIHEDGFLVQVQDPAGEEWGLEPGEGFSDGSVKWPRWFCLASGGMSLVQLDKDGNEARWHAATLSKGCRHVAVNTEMFAMAAAAVYAPENAEFTLWADCQSVVSGFAQLEKVADDHKNYYAGIWRIVRAALKDNGCRMSVKKVKAHRLVADVPEAEMFWWKGNEAADKWAKLGAEDRNEAWGDLVDKILTGNLRKARAVVTWLGDGDWPDGRALGKSKGCCARADFDLKPRPKAHEWTWYPKGWRCTKCGARRHKQGGGATKI